MFDFSVYLVVSPSKLAQHSAEQTAIRTQINELIDAGVTAIQLREDKQIASSSFLKVAKAVHSVASKRGVAVIIWNRPGLAVSAGVDGVELGSGSLDFRTVRDIVGPEKLIGVTISNSEQVEIADWAGNDYSVIGPVFQPAHGEVFQTRCEPLQPEGATHLVDHLAALGNKNPILLYGGLNVGNIQSTLLKCGNGLAGRGVDGVVLNYPSYVKPERMLPIIREVVRLLDDSPPPQDIQRISRKTPEVTRSRDIATLLAGIPARFQNATGPTACVVPEWRKVFVGKVATAMGSRAIFANAPDDFPLPTDYQNLKSCLMYVGSTAKELFDIYSSALQTYNEVECPVVFDFTGASDSYLQTLFVEMLFMAGNFAMITGSYADIVYLGGALDLDPESLTGQGCRVPVAKACRETAITNECVVVAQGPHGDEIILSDSSHTAIITARHGSLAPNPNCGDSALGMICAVLIGSEKEDMFLAVLSGLVLLLSATEFTWENEKTTGPGTFGDMLVDTLWRMVAMAADKPTSTPRWTEKATVRLFSDSELEETN